MNNKVFISGSISIKKLTGEVKESLDKIVENNINVLVGDAQGIDSLVQNYFLLKQYFNVTVYGISYLPRYIANDKFTFKHIEVSNSIKKERERQQEKDKNMTFDSQYSFVIWDGKSKGSYANIIRALEQKKKIKIYLSNKNKFFSPEKIKIAEITFIYRENNGYTASEIIEYLNTQDIGIFARTQDLNKYLMEKLIIIRENKIYKPSSNYESLFIIDTYRGRVKGIKFKNEFIDWIEKALQSNLQKTNLFEL